MPNTKVAKFSDRLNYLIAKSEKTASQFAHDLGLSKQAISTWQTGLREPRRPTLETIARYFNVDIAWLMGYDTEMYPKVDKEKHAANHLPESQDNDIIILTHVAKQMSAEDRENLMVVARIMFKEAFEEAEKEK